MTAAEIQQRIDAGIYRVPSGQHTPEAPLFLDANDAGVWGFKDGRTEFVCNSCGTAVVVGWRRGLVSGVHYTASGFRTFGDSWLWARGTEFDLGPLYPIGTRGYAGRTKLRVKLGVTLEEAGDWVGGSFLNVSLCGMQSNFYGPTPSGHPARPSPWSLYWDVTTGLELAVLTSDGVIRRFAVAAPASNPVLDLDVTLDLAAGTCVATVGGSAVTVGLANAGAGWGPGLALAGNSDAPFCLGRIDPSCNSEGWWGSNTRDMTIRQFEVTTDLADWFARALVTDPRPATYPGGPSLPLVTGYTQFGSRWLFAVHTSQGVPDSVSNVTVRDVVFTNGNGAPTITLGGVQGGFRVERCQFQGGSRAVQTSQLAVVYPVHLSDCDFYTQYDRHLHLCRAATASAERCQFRYGHLGLATLIQCNMTVRDSYNQPPGPPPQDRVFDQYGGQVSYSNVMSDYEYADSPPIVTLTPYSAESPEWETRADFERCGSGDGGLCDRLTAQTGYAGPVAVAVNGAAVDVAAGERVAADGTVSPT